MIQTTPCPQKSIKKLSSSLYQRSLNKLKRSQVIIVEVNKTYLQKQTTSRIETSKQTTEIPNLELYST